MLRVTWFTRSWIAATALLAGALATTLPTPTFAQDGQKAGVASASSAGRLAVGDVAFEDLVVASAATDVASAGARVPSLPDALKAPASVAGRAITRAPRTGRPANVNRAPAVGGGTWALVVGVNDYPGTAADLGAAANDAAEVERAMLMLGAGRDHVLTLLDGAATGGAIRAGLDWLIANAGPDAVAVVFFAGHAVKPAPGLEAIVAADGEWIFDNEMGDRLAPLAARRAWIAIAGCYGGGFTEVLAPGRILTGAAAADGLAYENSAFNRSYMVEYMVHRAIVEGRADSSVQAAFAYAADALARDYPGREPVQIDEGGGPLDLRPSSPPPSQPAPPPTGGGSPPPTTAPPADRGCWLGLCG